MVKPGDIGRDLKAVWVGDGAAELEEVTDNILDIEMVGSGGFRVKMGVFSSFLRFYAKLAASERVLRAETMVVYSVDSLGACDSKTAHNNTLFS